MKDPTIITGPSRAAEQPLDALGGALAGLVQVPTDDRWHPVTVGTWLKASPDGVLLGDVAVLMAEEEGNPPKATDAPRPLELPGEGGA